jgi:hypothetical protein
VLVFFKNIINRFNKKKEVDEMEEVRNQLSNIRSQQIDLLEKVERLRNTDTDTKKRSAFRKICLSIEYSLTEIEQAIRQTQ